MKKIITILTVITLAALGAQAQSCKALTSTPTAGIKAATNKVAHVATPAAPKSFTTYSISGTVSDVNSGAGTVSVRKMDISQAFSTNPKTDVVNFENGSKELRDIEVGSKIRVVYREYTDGDRMVLKLIVGPVPKVNVSRVLVDGLK